MSAKTPLMIHAEAAAATAKARTAYDEAVAANAALSIGEHPDVLEDADTVEQAARNVWIQAVAAEKQAYIAYTDPQGRGRAADTVPVYWPANGSLDPALTLG